jgi:hypothetical protein
MKRSIPLIAMILLAAGTALAVDTYTIQELPTLGGPESGALGINNAGLVVGYATLQHNLRGAAALGRLDELGEFFEDDGTLRPEAACGRGFYRPGFLFPQWKPSDDRQELLDEALTWAARSGRVASLEELVRRGADVNSNPYRGTPLLWTIYSGRHDATRWLLDHGADPDLKHDFGGAQHGRGATALHLAAQFNNLDSIRLLLDRGADPSVTDDLYKATPVGWAEFAGQQEACDLLTRQA